MVSVFMPEIGSLGKRALVQSMRRHDSRRAWSAHATHNPSDQWALDNVRVAATIRPVLAMRGLTNRVVLSWTTNAFGLHLETTTHLSNGAGWVLLQA
jgi:hypothetical protein